MAPLTVPFSTNASHLPAIVPIQPVETSITLREICGAHSMPKPAPEGEFSVASMDAQMSKLDKGYSTDGDADPETGDAEPMPTRMGMEISFKVRNPGVQPPTPPEG